VSGTTGDEQGDAAPSGPVPSPLEAPESLAVSPATGALGTFSRGFTVRGTRWMFLGAAVAAVGAYVFQVVGARSLGEVGYAPISALWTIQYLVVSVVLYPIETYVTRRTLLDPHPGRPDRSLVRVWGWVALIALVLSSGSWALRERLFQGVGDLALVVAAVTVAFAAFMIVRGKLAGTERFKAYGLVTGAESAGRAVVGIAVASLAATTRAFAWVMPVGAAGAATLWLLLRRRPRTARAVAMADAPDRPLRFLALTTAANGLLQLMLAGGPLALVFLGARPREVSVLFVTLAAARVPLVFLFSGLLSRVFPTFIRLTAEDAGQDLRRAADWIALGTVSVALVGGLGAAAVGSTLIRVLFGASFAPAWWVASGVTVGVLLATGSMVLGQLLVAQGREDRSFAAWVLATAVAAVGMAIVDGGDTGRVVGAFVMGESAAVVALAIWARGLPVRRRREAPASPERGS
jgi:O-antigen/teichoic acid export membrane protein